MIKRIHILGASGSGTTTLAREIEARLGYKHFDTDDYYWMKTDPPFQVKRNIHERIELLDRELKASDQWVLSGSLCGWGDVFIPQFDLVVFLWIPQEVRLKRLAERESKRYGRSLSPGEGLYNSYIEFMEWAAQYDTGGLEMRSKKLHEEWLSHLPCKVLRIEADLELEDKLQRVITILNEDAN